MTSYSSKKQTLRQKHLALRRWLVGTACRVTMVSVTAVVGILYVVQMSAVSTKGYDIARLQKQIQSLEQENQRLSVEIAAASSIESIEGRLARMDLVRIDEIQYLSAGGNIVARR